MAPLKGMASHAVQLQILHLPRFGFDLVESGLVLDIFRAFYVWIFIYFLNVLEGNMTGRAQS
jgi:hypothetical protein